MAISLSLAKELLATLVAFDTTSAKTNLPLIGFLKSFLSEHGVRTALVPNDEGDKASLFATIGEGEGGIGLSGHTDVVPVTGQNWDSDPFSLTEKDGALYGRGTADMKGFLACMLAMVPEAANRPLSRPIHLIFSYDEEVGCTGVCPLIDELGGRLERPDVTIVGEPTNMTVVDAHKSIHTFVTEITGKEAHSSLPDRGVNAIFAASAFLGEIERLSRDAAYVGHDERFDPPRSTIHVGKITGGTALNIVPKSCRILWEIRALPGVNVDAILARLRSFVDAELLPPMRAVSPDADVKITPGHHVPGFATRAGSKAVSLALGLAEQNETFAVSYGTEAGHFENHGIDTVICGPGSIKQAHQPNEFIEIDELAKCLTFLDRLIDAAAAAPGQA